MAIDVGQNRGTKQGLGYNETKRTTTTMDNVGDYTHNDTTKDPHSRALQRWCVEEKREIFFLLLRGFFYIILFFFFFFFF
jgi:hypothetical protein